MGFPAVTPVKCWEHELRRGELGDSPRYVRALVESRSCWRCRVLAMLAPLVQRLTEPPKGSVEQEPRARAWGRLGPCAVCGEVDEHLIHHTRRGTPIPSGRETHAFVPQERTKKGPDPEGG